MDENTPLPSLEEVARFDDRAFWLDPYPVYSRLRREAPVWWCDAVSAWVVTRYADVTHLLTASRIFSSAPLKSRRFPYNDAESGMAIVTDPPKHQRVRSLFVSGGAYSTGVVRALQTEMDDICNAVVDELPEGEIDVVTQLVLPAVARIGERFFGLPPRQGPTESRWQDALLVYYAPGTGELTDGIIEYFLRVIGSRRENPGNDPISHVVSANEDERLLTDEQLAWNLYDTILAGCASMTASAAEAIGALAEHPRGQAADFWVSQEIAERSADELLRWVNHIHVLIRTSTEDVELGGQSILRGQKVYAVIASANRDGTVWERADDLDLGRDPGPAYLSFGYGRHMSNGRMLSRVFIATLLATFVRRWGRFELSGKIQRRTTGGGEGVSTPQHIPVVRRSKH